MNVFITRYDRARLESLRMRKYFCMFRYGKVEYRVVQEETLCSFLQYFTYVPS